MPGAGTDMWLRFALGELGNKYIRLNCIQLWTYDINPKHSRWVRMWHVMKFWLGTGCTQQVAKTAPVHKFRHQYFMTSVLASQYGCSHSAFFCWCAIALGAANAWGKCLVTPLRHPTAFLLKPVVSRHTHSSRGLTLICDQWDRNVVEVLEAVLWLFFAETWSFSFALSAWL